ncbi:TonB-dependent receptor [Lentibacter algarum]|uniref:TonB-dependent receptor plug domain-containing protein n=2 Tax=Lentibacter algarum TaxID=576131 RepID=UPI00339D7110
MHSTLKASAALALLISHTPAYAQEAFDLGEITLFSSFVPTELSKTGTTTQVVTEEALQDGGTQQVVVRIGQQPGVSFAGNGSVGATQLLSVRGLPSQFVSVFFEGIDMSDPSQLQNLFDWGGTMNTGLGRVEVLKGSQSTHYGSEAIGGVINLSAMRLADEGQKYTFGTEVGSYNTKSVSFTYLRKTDRADISFSLVKMNTDGFSSADENDGFNEADYYRGINSHLSASFEATDSLTLGATLIYADADMNIEDTDSNYVLTDGDTPYFSTRTGARVFAMLEGEGVDHEFGLSTHSTRRREPSSIFTKVFEGDRTEIDYKGTGQTGFGSVTFGASHSIESSSLDSTKTETNTSGVFAELLTPLSADVDLSLAARYENHSQFGGALTGRAALAVRTSEATTFRAAVSSGFRAPSLYELFAPGDGNVNLNPERSVSFDLGVEHRYASGAKIEATAFYTEIDDLIDYVSGYQQVTGKYVAKGIELSGEFAVSTGVSLAGSYTYTDTADTNGYQFGRTPKHDISLGLNADISTRMSMGLNVNHAASRADDGYPSRAMEDYTVANATLNYVVSDNTELYLRVDNLFNEEYQTSGGYGTSDRALYFGVRASF